jgi:putative transposase
VKASLPVVATDNGGTTSHPIDVEKLLADQLATASPDLLRGLLSTFIATLMSAEADAVCGRVWRAQHVAVEPSQRLPASKFDTRADPLDGYASSGVFELF